MAARPDVGLVNCGATCYINSSMQMLYHIYPFSHGIMSIDNFNNNNSRNDFRNRILSLNSIFNRMSTMVSTVDIRTEIEPLFCLGGSVNPYVRQEDVSEFINMCISPSLQASEKAGAKAAYASILNNIRETISLRENPIRTAGRELITAKFVPQLMINIPIDRERGYTITSLQDGINQEFEVQEELFGGNLLKQTASEKSSVVPEYVKHQYKMRQFMSTGSHVIFDLKRWKQEGGVLRKIDRNVPIEKNITLLVNSEPQRFGIQGIIFQSGGMMGGHYVYAWCSNPDTNTWKTFNDTVVTEVRGFIGGMAEFTLPSLAGGGGDSNFNMKNAYVLVYQKDLVHDPGQGVQRVAQEEGHDYQFTFEMLGVPKSEYDFLAKTYPRLFKPIVPSGVPSGVSILFTSIGKLLKPSSIGSNKTLRNPSSTSGARTGPASKINNGQLNNFFTTPGTRAPAAPAPAAPAPAYKYTFETSGLSVSNYNTFAKFSPTEYAPRVKHKAPSLFGNNDAASAASEKASKSVKTLAAKLAAAKGASTGSAPRASAPRASAPRVSAPAPDPFAALDPFAAPAAPAASNNLLSFLTAPAPAAPAAPAPATPAPAAPAAPAPAPTPNGWVKFDGGSKRKTRKTKRKGNKRTRHRK